MRLSITTVEAYRLFLSGDWMALEDLEATIRKDAPENEAMRRGKAFHAILERPDECRQVYPAGSHYEAEDRAFTASGIEKVLELVPAHRIAEVKSTLDVDGITLSGVADALYGLDVDEYKCTAKIDTEKYFDSFQWRAYLVMFNAARVRYVLAQYRDIADDGTLADGRVFVDIINVLPMTLYRYPAVYDDVRRLTHECADFIVQRGLEAYVQDKPEDIAA